MPIFCGNPLEWTEFVTQFKNCTRIYNLSSYENLLRLQKSLKWKAKDVVQSLLIQPDNVDRVLEKWFSRAEYIIHQLLDKVQHFPVIKDNKIEPLFSCFDNLSNLVHTLEVYNQTDRICSPILFRYVLNKLSMSQIMFFIQFHNQNPTRNPSIIDLHSWLNSKVNAVSFLIIPISEDKSKSVN